MYVSRCLDIYVSAVEVTEEQLAINEACQHVDDFRHAKHHTFPRHNDR